MYVRKLASTSFRGSVCSKFCLLKSSGSRAHSDFTMILLFNQYEEYKPGFILLKTIRLPLAPHSLKPVWLGSIFYTVTSYYLHKYQVFLRSTKHVCFYFKVLHSVPKFVSIWIFLKCIETFTSAGKASLKPLCVSWLNIAGWNGIELIRCIMSV